jgi:transposase
LPVEGIGLDVIQAPKQESRIMRHELSGFEWATVRSFLTRYDKLAANYLAFIKLASTRIWLRANEGVP